MYCFNPLTNIDILIVSSRFLESGNDFTREQYHSGNRHVINSILDFSSSMPFHNDVDCALSMYHLERYVRV